MPTTITTTDDVLREHDLDEHEQELIAAVGLDPNNHDDVEFFYQQEREHETSQPGMDWTAIIAEREAGK